MKAIYKALLGLALMTAVPTSFTSCREDAPSVNQTADITIKNEFSKLVEAINNGNLKREEAIKKVMDMVIEKNVFRIKGHGLIKALDAKIVETNTETYDLVL